MRILRACILRVLDTLGYRLERKSGPGKMHLPPDFSREVAATVEAVQPYTMTSPERIASLVHAVEYVARHDIPGDIVECGVWKGGSMMAIARTLQRLNRTDRRLLLFDTFDGMPPATDDDRDLQGASASAQLAGADRNSDAIIWARAQLDEVQQNLRGTGYPAERMEFIKGKVEDTVPARSPQRIALLRLDTDWYESTRHELEHLFPRLSDGGVLIIDDYGHWQGARKAVDEYFEKHGISLLLCRIDYTGRIAVKLPAGVGR